jgi:hypothetical protein
MALLSSFEPAWAHLGSSGDEIDTDINTDISINSDIFGTYSLLPDWIEDDIAISGDDLERSWDLFPEVASLPALLGELPEELSERISPPATSPLLSDHDYSLSPDNSHSGETVKVLQTNRPNKRSLLKNATRKNVANFKLPAKLKFPGWKGILAKQ